MTTEAEARSMERDKIVACMDGLPEVDRRPSVPPDPLLGFDQEGSVCDSGQLAAISRMEL
jgi:hypothetical protein